MRSTRWVINGRKGRAMTENPRISFIILLLLLLSKGMTPTSRTKQCPGLMYQGVIGSLGYIFSSRAKGGGKGMGCFVQRKAGEWVGVVEQINC